MFSTKATTVNIMKYMSFSSSKSCVRYYSQDTLREEVAQMRRLVSQQQHMLEVIMNKLDGKKTENYVNETSAQVTTSDFDYLNPPEAVVQKNPRGFQEFERRAEPYRPPRFRVRDWAEINETDVSVSALKLQAARCMDCGTPFCQTYTGCPINNLIPEWNALVLQDQWKEAYHRLSKTNNFPEFTGRVCPAPCEGACVAGIYSEKEAVTIKNIEYKIIDTAFKKGWVKPRYVSVERRTGKSVAVIGSGPAGLACADELNQMGHSVSVFERAKIIGGLMHYGIPNMKIDKSQVARRVALLEEEGITFIPNAYVGEDLEATSLESSFDAICIAIGATVPRELNVAGSELQGVMFAMDFLTANQLSLDSNQDVAKDFSAEGKNVVVIGGGDTGTDCISTALRQYCKSLVNLEVLQKNPAVRDEESGYWPLYPKVYKVDYGHEEAQEVFGNDPREYAVKTVEVLGEEGKVTGVRTVSLDSSKKVIQGSDKVIPADLVLLAMGFTGPEEKILEALDIERLETSKYSTSKEKIFMAGDCRRGQSLVVWAINEGREAAEKVDYYLSHIERAKVTKKLQKA